MQSGELDCDESVRLVFARGMTRCICMSNDASGTVLVFGCNPDCGIIGDVGQRSGAMTRIVAGFLLSFELSIRLAEITEVWPLRFEGLRVSDIWGMLD